MNKGGQRIFSLFFLITFFHQPFAHGQTSENELRRKLAYEFLYDSISTKIDIGWMISEPFEMPDSIFLPCDSTPVYTKSVVNASGKYQSIESDTPFYHFHNYDNYLFRSLGAALCEEFIWSKRHIKPENWDVSEFKDKQVHDWLDSLTCDQVCSCQLSIPIFNRDYTKFILSASRWCGSLCGYGFTSLYSLVDGKWIEKRIITWVS